MEIHEHTNERRNLDAAYVRILTGLNSVNGILTCKINGETHNIRIDEMCCMDNVVPTQRCWETDSDSVDGLLGDMDSLVADSFAEYKGWPPVTEQIVGGNLQGTGDASFPAPHASRPAAHDTSEHENAATLNHEDGGGKLSPSPEGRCHPVPHNGPKSRPIDVGPDRMDNGALIDFGPQCVECLLLQTSSSKEGGPTFKQNQVYESSPRIGVRHFDTDDDEEISNTENSNQVTERREATVTKGRDPSEEESKGKDRKMGRQKAGDWERGRENGQRERGSEIAKEEVRKRGAEGWKFGKILGLKAREEDKLIHILGGCEIDAAGQGVRETEV